MGLIRLGKEATAVFVVFVLAVLFIASADYRASLAAPPAPYSAVFYFWNGGAAATGFRSLEQFATRAKCVEFVTPIARQLFPLLQANGARANAFCATETDLRSSNFGPAIQ